MELIDSQTYKNLAKSYAGECQDHVRYKFIEYGARMQEYKALAELIDKIVFNEFNHARMFYTFIQKASDKPIKNIEVCSGYPYKEKWDLLENLKLAAEDEEIEATKVYPEYLRVAREEGFEEIAKLYEDIIKVELAHMQVFKELYKQMKSKTLYKRSQKVKWKCGDCGYEAYGKTPWDICPLCQAKIGAVLLKLDDINTTN